MAHPPDNSLFIKSNEPMLVLTNEQLEGLRATVKAFVIRHAGSYADALLDSRDSAFRHLFHESAIVRACAIDSCFYFWGGDADEEYQQRLIELIADDSDEGVLLIASRVAGTIWAGSQHPDVRRVLARLVKNEHRSNAVRSDAYIALWTVEHGNTVGISSYEDENIKAHMNGTAPSMEGVDWEFVNRMLILQR